MAAKTRTVEPTAIKLVCPKCQRDREVQGLSWNAIAEHLGQDLAALNTEPVSQLCANCRYRAEHKNRPMSPEQKAKRAEYNKRRREEIKQALEFMRSQQDAEAEDTDE